MRSTPSRAVSAFLSAALGASLGCAMVPAGCPEGYAPEVCRDPGALLAHADDAMKKRDHEEAFRDLKLIRTLHPGSTEANDPGHYVAATKLFKRLWYRDRLKPDSPWLGTERDFMFGWLESYYESDSYPRTETELLLVGMPYGFYRQFEAYRATRPAMARFPLRALEDNGKVQSVSLSRSGD